MSCVLTREPGGTPGAEAIRELLLHPPGEGWGAEAEALLFAAARADHAARLIRPALATERWVVCDRFVDSSRAYQGAAGALGDDAVRALHDIGSDGLLPDLTIVMTASPERVADRLAARDGGTADAIGGRAADYHAQVAAAFSRLCRRRSRPVRGDRRRGQRQSRPCARDGRGRPAMLIGHDEAWTAWRTALAGERMHHAWLLTGKAGLGKAAFALARRRTNW